MSLKRFGYWKGIRRPKTAEDWNKLWDEHKIVLPSSIAKLQLHWSTKSPGQTGIRYFKAYKVPPILHWNPQITVDKPVLNQEKTFEPKVTITFINDRVKSIGVSDLKDEVIVDRIRRVAEELSSEFSESDLKNKRLASTFTTTTTTSSSTTTTTTSATSTPTTKSKSTPTTKSKSKSKSKSK